ncbi:response regulator transcription factor [Nostoc ellipsosporum NOK]|nr:response regulator transcription factor [Nostoc ellipsosporum NOK]
MEKSIPKPIRVITVDDHQILRGGIKFLLLAFDDLKLVGEAANGEEALHLCEQLQPDVVLMDLMMSGMNGAETTKAIKRKYPKIQVLVLTSFMETELIKQAMTAGAIGYLLKGASIDELADAIRASAAGHSMLSTEAIQALCDTPKSSLPVETLSKRQQEVLELIALGLTNEAIAERMRLSPSTIRHHITHILSRLGVANRTEAATRLFAETHTA